MAIQIPPLSAPPGYRTQADDTGVETDLLCFYLLRHKTVPERLQMAAQLTRSARKLSLNCFHERFTHLNAPQFARKIAEVWLQEHCPSDYVPGGSEMTWIQDSIQLAGDLHRIFVTEDIPYYVTGGVAAIAYGESRTTQDLDIVLFISREVLPALVSTLETAGFYVPGIEDVMTGQIQTLQVTQIDTISRADLVIADDNQYEQLKLTRRKSYHLTDETAIYLISPEDLVVNKLRWGQHSQSQKQWRDVLGVLKAQQDNLDYEHMHLWTAEFNLEDLLEQATLEAGVREIADRQWAISIYPTICEAFALARERNRISRPKVNIQIAEGNAYTLVQDDEAQTLGVINKVGDREIACFDSEGNVLSVSPSLRDRRQWQAISQRLR